MSSSFPFVQIPKELEPIIGKPDPGTRLYRCEGSEEESGAWFELLTGIIGPSVSPGGVSMFCPVARPAVYKKVKEGQLSMFLFHVTHKKTTLFGQSKILRSSPYGYIPVSEVQAWRKELEERAVRLKKITQEELVGSRPDWHGEFLEWKNDNERPNLLDLSGSWAEKPASALKDLAKALLGGGKHGLL